MPSYSLAMLVGLPWNLPVRPLDAARSSKTGGARSADSVELTAVEAETPEAAPSLTPSPEHLAGLERVIHFSGKSQNGFAMGSGFSWRTYEASPPPRRATRAEAVADYGKYLDKIVHAEGRRDHRPGEADHQSALTCVELEYNYLHRQPERVALFEHLVGLLQNPYNALGVLQDLESVPQDRRADVQAEIESRVRAGRTRTMAPQNLNETLLEGSTLNKMARELAVAGRIQRPGESLASLMSQLPEARKSLTADLKGTWLEAVEVASRYRKDGESLAEGVQTFSAAFHTMRHLTGLDSPTTLVVMGELPGSHPQQVEDLTECGRFLRELERPVPPEIAGPALTVAFTSPTRPLPLLKRAIRSYHLTGDLNGLESARAAIQSSLDSGRLIGTADEWMERLEHRLEELTLFEQDPQQAFARAKKELFETSAETLGQHEGFFIVGTSRLPLRLR